MDQKTICSTSFLTAASNTLSGTTCLRKSSSVCVLVASCSASLGSTVSPTPMPGFVMLTANRPMKSDCRDDLEVNERFERQPAHALHVVAVAGDANHQRGENQRHDQRLDHAEEDG